MGLNCEIVLIQLGNEAAGTNAVLVNSNGKVMKPPIAKTVSELRVRKPMAKDIPDHASPKKAIVKKIKNTPARPVTT
jgi:hypothetical protein